MLVTTTYLNLLLLLYVISSVSCSTITTDIFTSSQDNAKAVQNYLRLGFLHLQLGDHNKTRAFINTIFSIQQDYPPAYNLAGLLHISEDNYMLAQDSFSKAIALDKSFYAAINNAALTTFLLGDTENALLQLKKLLKHQLYTNIGDVYYNRAILNYSVNPQFALQDIQIAININDTKVTYYKFLFMLLIHNIYHPDAQGILSKYSQVLVESNANSVSEVLLSCHRAYAVIYTTFKDNVCKTRLKDLQVDFSQPLQTEVELQPIFQI